MEYIELQNVPTETVTALRYLSVLRQSIIHMSNIHATFQYSLGFSHPILRQYPAFQCPNGHRSLCACSNVAGGVASPGIMVVRHMGRINFKRSPILPAVRPFGILEP